jgi:hypothetical protein
MREIDSTPNSEARLRQALRTLSANAPGEAPPKIGDALTRAFRRHYARRRAIRRTIIAAALIAVLLPVVLLLRTRPPAPGIGKAQPPAPVFPTVVPPSPIAASASSTKASMKRLRTRSSDTKPATTVRNEFVVLPSSVHAVHGEDLRVIRLEVTGRALQVVGAPVSEAIADHRVLADFVVGQDGTPYAVRLVRQNNDF